MPERLPVVFVTTVFEGTETGPGTYARYLWNAFRDDPQIEFHLVAPTSSEAHPRIHATGVCGGSLALYRSIEESALDLAGRLGLRTIVHGNSAHGMGRFVRYGGPLIVQVNDYDVASVPGRLVDLFRQRGLRGLASGAWRHWRERRVLKRASVVVCNSDYTAAFVGRAYDLAPERMRVIYKAVETEAFARPGASTDAEVRIIGSRLLFVGADWRRKGLDTLLAAMPLVARTVPEIELEVIGPDPADSSLARIVRDLGLEDRVRLLGRMPPGLVATRLWNADVFVLPSRREALGVAVLEAMAAGVAVVSTRVGGIPEIVRNGDEGVLVMPDDVSSLADALGTLLDDPSRRRALRVAGVRRAQQFSVQAMVQEIRSLYLRLAGVTDSDHRPVRANVQ
jgi:glycosyltransferase involved in cell wall biosynthesis